LLFNFYHNVQKCQFFFSESSSEESGYSESSEQESTESEPEPAPKPKSKPKPKKSKKEDLINLLDLDDCMNEVILLRQSIVVLCNNDIKTRKNPRAHGADPHLSPVHSGQVKTESKFLILEQYAQFVRLAHRSVIFYI